MQQELSGEERRRRSEPVQQDQQLHVQSADAPPVVRPVQPFGYSPAVPPGCSSVYAVEVPTRVVVLVGQKSPALAAILAFLFGPLGMFYSTVGGAFVMLLVDLVVGVLTLGLGLLVTWPICVIWAALAASNHNAQLAALRFPRV